MRKMVLVADRDGAAAIPEKVRSSWDGVEWVFETSGLAALRTLRRVWPALMIVNLQLPDMCGSELIDKVRKGRPGLALVATSNLVNTLSERLSRLSGVVAYLPKPLAEEMVDQLLQSTVGDVGDWAARRAI